MYNSPRKKHWETRNNLLPPSPLTHLEDGFIPHPKNVNNITLASSYLTFGLVRNIKLFAVKHKLKVINFGTSAEVTIVVTLGSKEHAALFRLFWID